MFHVSIAASECYSEHLLNGELTMAKQDLKDAKLKEHIEAIEKHKSLLEKLHLDSNTHLDEVNNSISNLTLTLEEYLKVIGIP